MQTYAIEKCISLAAMSPHDEIRKHIVPTAQGQLVALKELFEYVQQSTEDRALHYDMRHLILEGRIARLKREMTQVIEELEALYREGENNRKEEE